MNMLGCILALVLAIPGARPSDRPAAHWTNTYGMTFVKVPAGSFLMGTPARDGVCPDCEGRGKDRRGGACPPCGAKGRRLLPEGEGSLLEVPQHRVEVPGFLLQTTELTRAQWKAVMGTEPWNRYDLFLKPGEDYPATFISHHDAEAFIARLNALDPTHVYRLPSEAEWEYAALAGGPGPGEADLGSRAWYAANAFNGGEKFTHRVAQKQPNAWGLYDMLGNTWEWVADAWNPDHRGHQGPGPRTTGDSTLRVQKGGSWRTDSRSVRPSARNSLAASEFAGALGFRVVAAVKEKGSPAVASAPKPLGKNNLNN